MEKWLSSATLFASKFFYFFFQKPQIEALYQALVDQINREIGVVQRRIEAEKVAEEQEKLRRLQEQVEQERRRKVEEAAAARRQDEERARKVEMEKRRREEEEEERRLEREERDRNQAEALRKQLGKRSFVCLFIFVPVLH